MVGQLNIYKALRAHAVLVQSALTLDEGVEA